MLKSIRDDVDNVREKDPAARGWLQVMLFYPGLQAVWSHRLAHICWRAGWHGLAYAIAYAARAITGIEIHPAARIGPRFFIDHGTGVVIGETAEIGADVTIYHGVTLGGVSTRRGKRHPTIGDGVVIGAGAKVLGAITIGNSTRIGANAVVVEDMAANCVVVGIPGRPIERKEKQMPYDLQHDELPDVVTSYLTNILRRLDQLEQQAEVDPDSIPQPEYHI